MRKEKNGQQGSEDNRKSAQTDTLVQRLSYKLQEKAGGTQKCSHFRSRKRKNGLKRKNQRDRVSYTAEKAALVISA
jgi:hypothetical protein|nr:MAG: hypothetical protein [Bacteriophage sp.]UVY11396.1 MAG: hypothetical protein [Bacteriophage sp.]UWD61561.1 MAG: hypothetical protein [Bacteriophage sp.]UWH99795.1 MAG: hypothetical protein [Bacteriophage sp.]UWI29131.1 MAG: hypothetical protein [Bacteriophage sp.]